MLCPSLILHPSPLCLVSYFHTVFSYTTPRSPSFHYLSQEEVDDEEEELYGKRLSNKKGAFFVAIVCVNLMRNKFVQHKEPASITSVILSSIY